MPVLSCAHCQTKHTWNVSPPRSCSKCGKPIQVTLDKSISELGGELDLKDSVSCAHCRYECYEENVQDGACPRCKKPFYGEEEGEEDEAPGAAKGARKKKPVKKAPAPPKKVMLTEDFKAKVFAAIRKADARTAQQLCRDLVGSEEGARQIYTHLLGIAKKKGWVGIEASGGAAAPPPPPPAAPAAPAAAGFEAPLALPPGIVGGPAPAPAAPSAAAFEPLALPAGILGGPPPGAGGPGPDDPGGATLRLPPGVASGQVPLGPGGWAPGVSSQGVAPPGWAPGAPPPGAWPGAPGAPGGWAPPGAPAAGAAPGGWAPPGGPGAPPGWTPSGWPQGPPPGAQAWQPPQAGGAGASTQGWAPPPGPGPVATQAWQPPPPTAPGAQPGQQPPVATQAWAPPGGAAPGAGPRPPATGRVPPGPQPAAGWPPPPAAGGAPPGARPPVTTGSGAAAAVRAAPAEPPPEPDPEERGFLARVSLEGRACQASLLCAAGRFAAARDLAQGAVGRDPQSARAHAALGEALAGLGEDAAALQAYTTALRADAQDPAIVRGYAALLVRLGRLPEAANAYRRIVGPGTGDVKDAVSLATVLRRQGDLPGAKRVFEEVLRRDPQSLEPLRQAAETRAAQGDVEGAAALLEQILAKERAPYTQGLLVAESLAGRAGGSPRAGLACARAFLTAGRPLAAVRLLAQQASRDPQNLEVRRVLGLAYARLGAGPLAEEHILAVLSRGAAGADELRALGEVYLERGDTASGVKALTQARDARPDDPDARRALARAFAVQGDLEGALRELRAAHRGREDDPALEEELDRLTERAFAKRIQSLEALLATDEGNAQARLDLAEALAQRGDVDEAIEHVSRAAKTTGFLEEAVALAERLREEAQDGPQRRRLALLLARLRAAEDPARAVALVEELLAEVPDDGEARLVLYELLLGGERVQDAVVGLRALLEDAPPHQVRAAATVAERVLETQGSYPGLALSLGRALRKLGETDRAVKHYERYVAAEPEDLDVRRELARVLEAAGRPDAAYEALKVLVADGAGAAADLERVGSLALAAGRTEEAVALLRRATALDPEDLTLKRTYEATQARVREAEIARIARAMEGAAQDDDRLRLAALYAEAGRTADAQAQLSALGRLGDNPELGYLRFAAEHFARSGQNARAEEALRQIARLLGYAPGSEQHKQLLHRIAGLYERSGERRAARRVYLEVFALDPAYKDVDARVEALSEDVTGTASALDERLLELVDAGGAPGSIFDALAAVDLAIDPRVLAQVLRSAPGG